MAEQLNRVVVNVEYDNLVNSAFKTDVFGVTIASGQGELKRGTALALNSAGKCVILGTADATANCILVKDVDATSSDVIAMAYREGHFNTGALIVKDDYTLTAADKEAFRTKNIILSDEL